MSDRDELARLIATMRLAPVDQPDRIDVDVLGGPIADAVVAAGWRKKPTREAVEFALYERLGGNVELGEPFMPDHYNRMKAENLADAVLALLDGPTNEESER